MLEPALRDHLWRQVRDAVARHQPYDHREVGSRTRFLLAMERLSHPFEQASDRVHVTGSAIVTGSRGVVLHLHRRLGLWLQPGGHLDPGESPWAAALREAGEETGLSLRYAEPVPLLFHLDVHNGGRGHIHLDLRYRLLAGGDDPAPPPGESQLARWFTHAEALRVADPGLRGALLKLGPAAASGQPGMVAAR